MKQVLIFILLWMGCGSAYSQDNNLSRVSFSAHALFQAFKIPFASPSTYIGNKGMSAAVSYHFAGKNTFQQNLELGYFFNKYHGNSYMISGSTTYNPIHTSSVMAGVSLGLGYMNTGFSDGGWEQNDHGDWVSSSNRIGNLFIPAGFHIKLKVQENERMALYPVLTYQVNALLNYSHAATILPQSIIKTGINLRLK